jgi:hypothetical protein
VRESFEKMMSLIDGRLWWGEARGGARARDTTVRTSGQQRDQWLDGTCIASTWG